MLRKFLTLKKGACGGDVALDIVVCYGKYTNIMLCLVFVSRCVRHPPGLVCLSAFILREKYDTCE